AGVSHAVDYKGRVSADSKRVEEGSWSIQGTAGGTFTLKKKEHLESKKQANLAQCAGIWKGQYRYPDGAGQEPVSFTLLLVPQGDSLAGTIKETRTFGRDGAPWLHASVEARFDPEKRTFSFIKTYDGTAQIEHDVRYQGILASDGSKVDGTWKIGNG